MSFKYENILGYISLVLAILIPPIGLVMSLIILKENKEDTKGLIAAVIGGILTVAAVTTTFIYLL